MFTITTKKKVYESRYKDKFVKDFGQDVYDRLMDACYKWDKLYFENPHTEDIKVLIENEHFQGICAMYDVIGKENFVSFLSEWIARNHQEFVLPLAWISDDYCVPQKNYGIPICWICESQDLPRVFEEYERSKNFKSSKC